MKRLFARPIRVLNVANLAVLVGGLVVALRLESPHAVQRTGAIMAAVTGLFVIWQVLDEIRMESLLDREAQNNSTADLPALDRVAAKLQLAAEHRKASAVRRARLTMVVLIAAWLSVGEALHGFGDMMFLLFGVGAPHAQQAEGPPLSLSPPSAAHPHTAP